MAEQWCGNIDASTFGPVASQAMTDAALAAARQWLFQPAQAPFTALIGFHFIGPEVVAVRLLRRFASAATSPTR